jgi:hypothetical protein
LLCLKNMLLYQKKSYLCKILFVLYGSNGFKPYIFFDFHNLSMYHTHTHTFYWPYTKIRWISSFRTVNEVFRTVKAVFIGHVWPLGRTYPISRACPAPGPDISGSRVSQLYNWDPVPLGTLASFFHPSRVCVAAGLSQGNLGTPPPKPLDF